MASESGGSHGASHGASHAAWQQWLGRHGPGLVLFARQWVGNAADAEDAVQEGFVRFWRARERARDAGYLYRCVRSAAVDLARSHRRRRAAGLEASPLEPAALVPAGYGGAMGQGAEQAELAATIEASLGRLPAEQREVVVMKVWGGLTFAEIAKVVGVSPNTAASRYRYALERLEADLAGLSDSSDSSDVSDSSNLSEEVSRE